MGSLWLRDACIGPPDCQEGSIAGKSGCFMTILAVRRLFTKRSQLLSSASTAACNIVHMHSVISVLRRQTSESRETGRGERELRKQEDSTSSRVLRDEPHASHTRVCADGCMGTDPRQESVSNSFSPHQQLLKWHC